MFKIRQKFTGLILTLSFVAVTLFGLNMGMDTRQDGTMSVCIFDQSVTCSMNYQEHINHWQQTVVAAQPMQNTTLTLLIVITLGGAALLFYSLLKRNSCAQVVHHIAQSIQRQREIIAKLSDHILQALSDGILNPRLYNFRIVFASG